MDTKRNREICVILKQLCEVLKSAEDNHRTANVASSNLYNALGFDPLLKLVYFRCPSDFGPISVRWPSGFRPVSVRFPFGFRPVSVRFLVLTLLLLLCNSSFSNCFSFYVHFPYLSLFVCSIRICPSLCQCLPVVQISLCSMFKISPFFVSFVFMSVCIFVSFCPCLSLSLIFASVLSL